ncbi:Pre-mRNA-processing factor 19 [Podospora aff. communis PSN243]|uniref:Pre-mRNA-processing factor 19 n=1 Tax=Podospora aff. communis PSN243 TaxID=3040156 RepID=A0AAV9GN74_9PEZI|nr:Pre-mRNA-processing factor 19 [Podospora aff. communis PSN243]
MLCALSGEIPEEPVASRKTGAVFEKRLILKYIEENGKEPGTDDELHLDDLLEIKTNRVVRPRPPNFTSLPSLLKAFQDEWDALVIESYETKQQLARTREELATALYQHDAAVRVIARLTKERDEARDALSKVTVAPSGGDASNDAMAIDNDSLPEALVEHVNKLQSQLTKGRKKRPVPEGWATPDEVAALQQTAITDLSVASASSLDIQGEHVAIGGLDGKLDIYAVEAGKVERSLDIGEPVTATVWIDTKVILATAKGSVRVFDSGSEAATFKSHAGAVTGLALHPGNRILASVGADKSLVFYDLEALERVSRVYTDSALTSCAFHPDGHLFAAGTQAGDIKIFHTVSGEEATTFALGSPVQALVFSENGFWFAASGKGQSTVTVFDLRKEGAAAQVRELQTGDAQSLAWDYTGQFLATAGSTGITVQQYLKSSKSWSEPFRNSTAGVALRWGSDAKTLVTVNKEGVISVLGAKED